MFKKDSVQENAYQPKSKVLFKKQEGNFRKEFIGDRASETKHTLGKFQEIKNRIFTKWNIVIFATVILVLILTNLGLTLEHFNISEVTFKSANDQNNTILFANKSKIDIEGKKLIGKNYFLVNVSQVLNTIRFSDPFIEKGYFEKKFPNTIEFVLFEREPFIIYQLNSQTCLLLDKNAYVVEIKELKDVENKSCEDLKNKYSLSVIVIENFNDGYKLGEQTNKYYLEKIKQAFPVLEFYKIENPSYLIKENGTFEVIDENSRVFTFSLDETLDEQLIKFKISYEQILEKKMDFKSLDLRYERPVVEN